MFEKFTVINRDSLCPMRYAQKLATCNAQPANIKPAQSTQLAGNGVFLLIPALIFISIPSLFDQKPDKPCHCQKGGQKK